MTKMALFKNNIILSKICYISRIHRIFAVPIFQRLFSSKNENESKLQSNPYFEKYAKKLEDMKSTEPLQFEARLDKLKEKRPIGKQREMLQESSFQRTELTHTRIKELDDIMKVEKIQSLSADEISHLWIEHFRGKDGICAVIPSHIYKQMYQRSLEYPTFLYPLVKGSGYEFMFSQFSGHSCYFTSLANYQVYKENAPVCLTITHFPELQDSKKIVLMCGEFDSDKLNVTEVQFLANQVQLYYSSTNVKKKLLLWTFNKDPQNFKHTDLIEEIETLQ